MRRLVIFLAFVALPAFAFRQSPPAGARIGVLRMSDDDAHGAEQTVAWTVQKELRGELRTLGFDAFDARTTYDDLARGSAPDADFYVEIVSSHAVSQPVGAAGIGSNAVGVDMAVVVSRVAAEVRIYDGKTLGLLNRYDLQQNRTAVVPTAVGFGGRFFWARIPLPFIEYAQVRSAAREVAREAAARIAGQ